jgi:hypothetical protein
MTIFPLLPGVSPVTVPLVFVALKETLGISFREEFADIEAETVNPNIVTPEGTFQVN